MSWDKPYKPWVALAWRYLQAVHNGCSCLAAFFLIFQAEVRAVRTTHSLANQRFSSPWNCDSDQTRLRKQSKYLREVGTNVLVQIVNTTDIVFRRLIDTKHSRTEVTS